MSPLGRGPGGRAEFMVPLFLYSSNATRQNLEHTSEGGVQRAAPQLSLLPLPQSWAMRGCRVRAHREDVKRDPLTEPKQDRPTKTGMIQDMTPR